MEVVASTNADGDRLFRAFAIDANTTPQLVAVLSDRQDTSVGLDRKKKRRESHVTFINNS